MNTAMTSTNQKQMQNDENRLSNIGDVGEQTYQATFSPRFDIWEGDDELVLYGDLPGVEPGDLEIQFENRQLTIHGKASRRGDEVNYLYSEYGVGDFHRSFTIGESINGEAISAELRHGVLTLHLPKSEAAKPRRIEVKAS
jgi:HSP20 family protein